ncbi:MAG: hypothetical protein WAV78_29775, partial [Xanthobacteraceae bacterium]
NKAERSAAELVERRAEAKGTARHQSMLRTAGAETVVMVERNMCNAVMRGNLNRRPDVGC